MNSTIKRILALILVAVMTVAFAGCEQNDKSQGSSNNNTSADSGSKPGDGTGNDKGEEEWGNRDTMVASNGSNVVSFSLSFPKYTGVMQASGWAAGQDEPVLVVVDGQYDGSSPVSGISDVFPTYFEQTSKVLESHFGSRSDNFEFFVDKKENVTVGAYEMIRIEGTCNYTYKKEPKTRKFIAYATQLKSNDAYVYWLLLDCSEDGSKLDLAADWAYRMALSLKEISY